VAEDRERARRQIERERINAGLVGDVIVSQAPSPGQGLHDLAAKREADLLVLGSCHRGALGRAMLGDDTRAGINGASCAVAVAPAGYAEHPKPLATIGVAYDGSEESKAALEVARALATRCDARVKVRQVVFLPTIVFSAVVSADLGPLIEQTIDDADRRIEEIPGVTGKAVYGAPNEELEAFSDDVDLLVVGSRGHGPVKRLVLGSTANHLARHARCALLVLPRVATVTAGDAGSVVQAHRGDPAGVRA
jgi:nucleotide-binding universal stress UspA family protein